MVKAIVAMTTTNTEREAKKIACVLVEKKKAACVQIIPKIHSIYEWKGEIHDDQEYLLLIKTQEKHAKDVMKLVRENHTYEVPEILILPVDTGSDEYLEWIKDVTD